MAQSPLLHAAIIMDGNGRWATARGLPRTAGHRAGAKTLRRIVEAAPGLGIGTLTVYAFSSDNWKRPPGEVNLLMRLFREYIEGECRNCIENDVRLSVIGRRDRLAPILVLAIESAEAATRHCGRLHLRIAVDYSARDAIVRAAARLKECETVEREDFARMLSEYGCAGEPAPDVDLAIRTGGEQRLSDFLLWECAYAELVFVRTPWPDFSVEELESALGDFRARDRRFGGLTPGQDAMGAASVHAG